MKQLTWDREQFVLDADLAAAKCYACGKFGHRLPECPRVCNVCHRSGCRGECQENMVPPGGFYAERERSRITEVPEEGIAGTWEAGQPNFWERFWGHSQT